METNTYDPTIATHPGIEAEEEDGATRVFSDSTLTIVYIIIGSIGMMGNLLVVTVIFTQTKLMKSLTNVYLINQSMIDGLVGLILVLSWSIDDEEGTLDKTKVGDVHFCKLWLTRIMLWSLLVSSSYNLVGVTFERYLSVVHPIWHLNNMTKKRAYISIFFIWISGFGMQLPVKYFTSEIINGACSYMSEWPNVTARRVVGIMLILYQFFIPLGILCFCYIRMAITLHKKAKEKTRAGATADSENAPNELERRLARVRDNVIKTLFVVSICYFICWVVNQTYFLVLNMGVPLSVSSTFYHLTVILTFSNCMINPFIYIARYDQFRDGIRSMFRKLAKKHNSVQPTSTTG